MEVKRTVLVKLSVPEDRQSDLHQTIGQFNHVCNYTVQHGRNDDGYLILTSRPQVWDGERERRLHRLRRFVVRPGVHGQAHDFSRR